MIKTGYSKDPGAESEEQSSLWLRSGSMDYMLLSVHQEDTCSSAFSQTGHLCIHMQKKLKINCGLAPAPSTTEGKLCFPTVQILIYMNGFYKRTSGRLNVNFLLTNSTKNPSVKTRVK